jgi:hypothetical protein
MNGIHYAKCEVCGKQDKAQNLMVLGGPFTYICESCRPLANKVIIKYRAMLRELPLETALKLILVEPKKVCGDTEK